MKAIYFIISLLLSTNMLGQTVNDHGLTVSMKDYVDMQGELTRELAKVQADHIIRSQDIRFNNVEKNVEKENVANDERLDGMNEFRKTLEDSNSTYVTWQALLGLMIGVSGFLFGYANYMNRKKEREEKERDRDSAGGKTIMSGDKREVKK